MSKLDDVRAFHTKMGLRTSDPCVGETRAVRERLIREECDELLRELGGDRLACLLESVDLVYVVMGALVERGFTQSDFDIAWAMIHSANMTKEPRPDGSGKVQKPADFEPVTTERLREVLDDPFWAYLNSVI